MTLYGWILLAFVAIFCLLFLYILIRVLVKKSKTKKIIQGSFNRNLLQIRFPAPDENNQNSVTDDINKFEQFLSVISSSGVFVFEVVIKQQSENIDFYMAVEKEYTDAIIKQLYARFPEYEIQKSKDYTIFKSGYVTEVGILQFTKPFFLPIRTYDDVGVDTFSNVLNSFSNIQKDEGIALQIAVRAAPSSVIKMFTKAVSQLRKGKSLKKIIKEIKHPFFSLLEELIFNNNKKEEDESSLHEENEDPHAMEMVQNKMNKPLYQVDVRVVVSSGTRARSQSILNSTELALQSFGTPTSNNFKFERKKKNRSVVYNFIFRLFLEKNSLILNSTEIATLFHFPTSQSIVDNIDWILARSLRSSAVMSSGIQDLTNHPQPAQPTQIPTPPLPVSEEHHAVQPAQLNAVQQSAQTPAPPLPVPEEHHTAQPVQSDNIQQTPPVQAPSAQTPIPEVFREGYLHVANSISRGQKKPFYISSDDRRRHFYSIGQTGTGKSALIKYLAYQDMILGNGLCVLDPNGDLVEDLSGIVPDSRRDDVIIFNPADLDRPLGLNMLEHNPNKPEEKTFIVNEIQSIFNRLFSAETMGPVFEQYMRNSLQLLMEDSKYDIPTLIDVPRLLTDSDFRGSKLSRSSNTIVNDFWRKEVEKIEGENALSNFAPYITSKFNGFIANDYLRPIIGQPSSALDFRKIMDTKQILLVKLPKGRLGEINANLLGMMLIGKLMLAAFSRDDIPEDSRQDFYCYIDEFQNFTTDTIAAILAEARKYRLNLTLAHQYISQLSEPIKNAVFGNVGNIAAFRIGVDDADFMAHQFNDALTPGDLINFKNLTGVIKILQNGQPVPPFSYKIDFAPKGNTAVAEEISNLSKDKYGKPLAEIEEYIRKRS